MRAIDSIENMLNQIFQHLAAKNAIDDLCKQFEDFASSHHQNVVTPTPVVPQVGAQSNLSIVSQEPCIRLYKLFLQSHSLETLMFPTFLSEFRKVFEHPLQQEASAKKLLGLHQGWKSVSEHSIEFRIAAE